MKRSMLAFFLALAFTACQESKRYTQQSAEIEAVKSLFAAYESGVLESQRPFYAENAQIFYNAPESEPSTLDEILAKQAEEMAEFSDFSITFDDDGIEMVVTDKGETWVNFWGEWHGTMKATGQKFVIPIHETLQFVDGKVVK
ncbi:nuclear transport factor 2 family protein [Algoriphagus sp. H41]|uniref:Nuclear transport factor 2 family protein n=1 Tax=Algoriphagus oliviformis TaxID=2811231 RepID=A0ABS3BY13_9BACT|nr:nuclear transport factor 2 family protein [Algoriphagus oliviformis]MBN7809753.1 nuclear transport factor 2 family protein [Algoriphagus oliviformis]